jgi:ADP-ribose pyrophosphatase
MIIHWKELKRREVFKKYSWLIQRRDYTLPNGKVEDYYIRVAKSGACVLAITKDNKVITVRQYRPGPNKIYLEMPGGFVDEGEAPKTAGMRELKEETGYTGEVVWSGQWQNDAYTEQERHVIVVVDCIKVAEPNLEATEFAEVELIRPEDFIKQARAGLLTDTAGALLGLDHLKLLNV